MPRPLGILAVFLATLFLTNAAAADDSPEQAVTRFLTLAYEGRFKELPKAAGARTTDFEQRVRNSLRVRCMRAEQVTLSRVAASGETVTFEAGVAVSKYDPAGTRPLAFDAIPLRIEAVKNGGTWLVAKIDDLDDELAGQLLDATPEERSRLREANPARMTKGLSRALYVRGLAVLNSSKLAAAARWAEATRVLEIAASVAIEAHDRGGEALALGAMIFATNDPQRAERLSDESIALAEAIGDPDVLARAWYDRGRAYSGSYWEAREAGRVAVRIATYEKALHYAERAEDPTIIVRTLYSIANINVNSHTDHVSARRNIDRSIQIARETGDANGEMGGETILASIYFQQGDPERALFHHNRALAIAEKLQAFGYPLLQLRSILALVDLGEPEKAREGLAKIITRDASGIRSSIQGPYLANALRGAAAIAIHDGDLDEAECLLREASGHRGSTPDVYRVDLAEYHLQRGEGRAALAASLSSLTDPNIFPDIQMRALIGAASAYGQLYDHERGLATIREAIDLTEYIDERVGGDATQRAAASKLVTIPVYEAATELALGRGDATQALSFLERGRARVLADTVENGRPGAMAEASALQKEEERKLAAEVSQLYAEQQRAVAAGDRVRSAALSDALRNARAKHASFVDGIRTRLDRQQTMRRSVDAEDLRALAANLRPDIAAVAYLMRDRELHIFVMRRDGIVYRTKDVPRATVEERVKQFVEGVSRRDLNAAQAARPLYELLIEPIRADLDGAQGLLIVPHGELWRVPFAALVDARGRFLVERYSIAYAPSIAAHFAIVASKQNRAPGALALLAVGNPSLDRESRTSAESYYRDATLGPLPEAEHEVDAVGALYARAGAVVLKRAEATEETAREVIGKARVVHFATHALFDDANPMYSRLALAAGSGGGGNDGWLESWEIARLDLSADVVVLSACDTARGKVGGGEGVVGMAWSFFLAGARSTVSAQWKVASSSTADLMTTFHRALRKTSGDASFRQAEALREAQLRLIRDARTRHPFYWGAFVLLGDPSF